MWMKNDEEGGIIDREKRATINSLMANINFKYKKTSDLQTTIKQKTTLING